MSLTKKICKRGIVLEHLSGNQNKLKHNNDDLTRTQAHKMPTQNNSPSKTEGTYEDKEEQKEELQHKLRLRRVNNKTGVILAFTDI